MSSVLVVFVQRVTIGRLMMVLIPSLVFLVSILPDEKLGDDGAGEEANTDAREDGGHHGEGRCRERIRGQIIHMRFYQITQISIAASVQHLDLDI